MLQEQRVTGDRRARSSNLIRKLVDARTEMLALYGELIGKRPFTADPSVPALVQRFCQSLVDYTAQAHFQLYRHFAENRERRVAVVGVAEEIYPRVLEITQSILDFNDKYDCEDHCEILSSLREDLSVLGEQLADRIELEDRLIAALTGSNLEQSRALALITTSSGAAVVRTLSGPAVRGGVMQNTEALRPGQLYRPCDPDQFSFHTTAELPDLGEIIGQVRALEAMCFGIGIANSGYFFFVFGFVGFGFFCFLFLLLCVLFCVFVVSFVWC